MPELLELQTERIAPVVSGAALPVCLAPWLENPYGLVSLVDMLEFAAHDFCQASGIIGQLYAQVKSGVIPQPGSWNLVAGELGALDRACENLGLTNTRAQVLRLKPLFMQGNDRVNYGDVARDIMEVHTRLLDELRSRLFLQVPIETSSFYEPSVPPFGQKVFDQFASAIDDIVESGNCLALGRDTAVVFHLMRVMEAGLKVLGSELGIPYAPSWESYLRQITKNVEADWASKTQAKRDRQPLYKDLAGDLQAVKIAWRNPTMHIVKKYGSDEALQIYNCVKQFMNRLADADFSE